MPMLRQYLEDESEIDFSVHDVIDSLDNIEVNGFWFECLKKLTLN